MKNIIISNQANFEKKLKAFKKAGAKVLHIVSDFDRTLTKVFVNGKKQPTSFAQIREGRYLSQEYVRKSYELRDKYYPIEQDPNYPINKKKKMMDEWWIKHLNLMVECGMNYGVIRDILNKNRIKAREGAPQFLRLLAKKKIPFLIFSAGLGDIIKGYLKKKNLLSDNIHLISNFYKFDKKGKVTGYRSKIVHSFNKNEIEIRDTKYYEEIKKRKNILLMADHIGDLDMTEGLKHDNIIRICFLNENIKTLIREYKKHFDVIILNDGPMDFVNDIITKI
jgi:5'-nucleotidase